MCTRFYVQPDTEEFREIIEETMKSRLADRFLRAGSAVKTSGEIRPTDTVPVVAPGRDGRRAAFPMRWGYRVDGTRTPVVNARTETASVRPLFRESWFKRRCAVPASWYFEWDRMPGTLKPGDKYSIQPRGSGVTWLAGLYRMEDGFPVFTVLTREPSESVARIHDRMPLILPGDIVGEWIRPGARAEELVGLALTDMVAEKAV